MNSGGMRRWWSGLAGGVGQRFNVILNLFALNTVAALVCRTLHPPLPHPKTPSNPPVNLTDRQATDRPPKNANENS
uniref:Putative secreted peptide n=1 Tax=Anopheles braziliensis TaxID=58242 RepID=A0A2M3ZSK8_9DIPT